MKNFRADTISKKLLLALTLTLVIGFGLIFGVFYYSLQQYETFVLNLSGRLLTDKFEQELQSSAEVGATMLEAIYSSADLSEAKKLELAQKVIGAAQFSQEGYYFVYQAGEGTIKIHGANPALQGESLWDAQDAEGNYFIRELDAAAKDGSLFATYQYPKPGEEAASPKLGAAMLVPNTDLVIGTGRYIDSIEADEAVIHSEIETLIGQTMLVSFGIFALVAVAVGGVVYIATRKITTPIAKIASLANTIAQGDVSQQIEINQQDEVGQLAEAFRQMVAYLQGMSGVADQIATGDLTGQITLRSDKDTFGQALQRMQHNLRQVISQLSMNAGAVNTTSHQLAAIAEQATEATNQIAGTIQQMATGTQEQTEAITRTAGSMEQVTRAISGVAQGAHEQSESINQTSQVMHDLGQLVEAIAAGTNEQTEAVAGAQNANVVLEQAVAQIAELATQVSHFIQQNLETAQSGQVVSQEAVAEMDQLGHTTDQLGQRIQELGKRSGQIGAVIEVIDDIASQTNLLALNAAIEAARAGEYGRGFAVVADEVRQLAERSSQATKEIRQMIEAVQGGAKEAVSAMEQAGADVQKGVSLTREAGSAFAAIAEGTAESNKQVAATVQAVEVIHVAVTQLQTAIAAVSGVAQRNRLAADEMRASSRSVMASVENVSAVVEENTASMEEMAASSAEVGDAIERIASVSEENSATVQEVSAATEELNAQTEEVSASAQSLQELAKNLKDVVGRFRLDKIETHSSEMVEGVDWDTVVEGAEGKVIAPNGRPVGHNGYH
ncbi:MAG: cache domain-containing protein [Anaerolineae bacterium]|nr:cache domain-containing protein [Anaerolineae bacterium]